MISPTPRLRGLKITYAKATGIKEKNLARVRWAPLEIVPIIYREARGERGSKEVRSQKSEVRGQRSEEKPEN